MISFYMNQHVPRAIIEGLRLRGVDVMIAFEDGASERGDSELLDRATEPGRIHFLITMMTSLRRPLQGKERVFPWPQ